MNLRESLDEFDVRVAAYQGDGKASLERLQVELDFAYRFAELFPDREIEWKKLVSNALESLKDSADPASAVSECESTLAPIGEVARGYTVHCCGHAHIDMNWLWPWPETVSVCHDTFATVDRLMDEFPEFRFSQSQAAVYAAMEEYCPEIFEMIKRRMKEGRWEPTASAWVEGDKNLANGESLCRHILYTKRYFKEHFGIPYDDLRIGWEPDTFGHAHSIPSILSRGGVTRYYHCRTGPVRWLAWWQGPDGSRVLLFLDKAWYNGAVEPGGISRHFIDYVKETGLRDFLTVYGVGDHGGGPTRRHLAKATELTDWPIFPSVRLSTTDDFFSAVEAANPDLPVYDGELNTIFEGCYTSQSGIKQANRQSENILSEAETLSILAGELTGFPYPMESLRKAWRMALFNQFHDILPGSGVRATCNHSQGLFQEIQAITDAIRTRAIRSVASRIDISGVFGLEQNLHLGDSAGAGAGCPGPCGLSAVSTGTDTLQPVIVFNTLHFPRSEMVEVKVWDKNLGVGPVAVRDDAGRSVLGQVVETGVYWQHSYSTVLFPARDVPAVGYRTFLIDCDPSPDTFAAAHSVETPSPGMLENDLVYVEVDLPSGAIKHLREKSTGYDYVPEGELIGFLELHQELPHKMTSWTIGEIGSVERLTDGWMLIDRSAGADIPSDGGSYYWEKEEIPCRGPHRASLTIGRMVNASRIFVEIGLNDGAPMVDFRISADWREIGTRSEGIPMLKIAFPLRMDEPTATYEIPFGSIRRPADGSEVPALRWADLSGKRVGTIGSCGCTLLNASKYGHSADGNSLRLTLLRSSCDPDPVPEIGHHEIRFAIALHDGHCNVAAATKGGAAFNQPLCTVNTDIHNGNLPSSSGSIEVLSGNVELSSMKMAEDGERILLRLFETEGRETEARIRLSFSRKPMSAVELDLMERPLPESSARISGDILILRIPPRGLVTLAIV